MLLDANSESLATGSAASFRPQGSVAPAVDRPAFTRNDLSGYANAFMRSMADTGRSLSRSASVIPNILDEFVGKDNLSGTSLTDQYEKFHEETFIRAVDYWTATPGEVGWVAQGLGEVTGGIVQFLANPALLINTAVMGTGEDLARQGVPADKAALAGTVAGVSTLAGIALPIFGKNIAGRIGTGVVGNVALNVPEAAIKREIVNDATPGMGDQFDPWDWRARSMDVLMGAVFGAKAHLDARYEAKTRDALMALNAARALEEGALPGRPATPQDITNAVERVKTAVDQLARGEVVTVPPPDIGGLRPDPVREQVASAVEGMLTRQLEPTRSAIDAFEAGLVDRLNSLGRTPAGANEGYARLTREFYEATAERIGISPEEMVNRYAVRVEGEGKGTFDQGPRTDWIELRPAENGDKPNPLSLFVERKGIAGAEGRLTRALERAEDVGGPDNQRMVFEKDGKKFVIGKLTAQDWIDRVRQNLTPDEITAARAWYGDLHRLMAQFFGDKDAEKYALAWLLSQQNESPSGGMRNVLRAADMVRGLPEIKKAGLAQGKLLETLRGQLPREGYDAKLLDFIDSELRRSTRTVMGDDPRGGQPAVIDVWANRDVGKVDDRTLRYIADTFGEEAARHVQIDGTGIGETDYEFGSKFYNRLVEEMNASGVDSGNWLPLEAQAVGWVAMQKQMGAKPEFPQDIFDKNTRRVSVGLAPGAGTRLNGEVPVKAAERVFQSAAEATGVKIRALSVGRGAYLGDGETAVQIDIMGSPESMQDFAAVVGHALQQTEVIVSRPIASGKTGGVTLTEVDGGKLTSMQAVADFMEAVRAKLPAGSTIADGYQVGVIDGRPTIRLFHGVYDEAAGRVKWDGTWKSKERAAFDRAVHEVANEKGIRLDYAESKFDIGSEYNDWAKHPDGAGYRDSLEGRGRSVLAERLGNDELRLLPEELSGQQGGGTYAQDARPAGSAEPAGGPGDGRGRPGSVEVTGIHYSHGQRQSLSGQKYGSGIRGAEARRIAQATDPRIKQRVYFYLQNDGAPLPQREGGLGANAHRAKLSNLYESGVSDPLQYTRLPDQDATNNAFESAVLDAGYDGYIHRGLNMAVVLGRDVPVEFVGNVLDGSMKQGNRGNITFGPDITQQPSVIRLLADADLSTYLHENGHLFLEVYADLAGRGTNPAIVGDMKTLIDWFGVKDIETWKTMTPEQRRPYHEQFAKGFEAYLRDGQAPTPGLRGLFAQFRDWLVSVYRSLKDLGVEPTPEVRGVFDRMLGGKVETPPKPPIAMPEMRAPEMRVAPGAGPDAEATLPKFADDLRLPTDEFDPKTGEPKTVSANELIARLEADAAEVKLTAEKFMETAAGCLLGGI